jgi:hypothetical protein
MPSITGFTNDAVDDIEVIRQQADGSRHGRTAAGECLSGSVDVCQPLGQSVGQRVHLQVVGDGGHGAIIHEPISVGKSTLATLQLLDEAVNVAGNFTSLSRITGISRRRIGYLLTGERPLDPSEHYTLSQVIKGKLR